MTGVHTPIAHIRDDGTPGVTGSMWATLPLGDEEPHGEWLAAYRIAEQDGQLVIAEIRILPWPSGSKEAAWVAASLRAQPEPMVEVDDEGNPVGPAFEEPKVPQGGLTARSARAGIRTAEALERVRRVAKHSANWAVPLHDLSPEALAEPRRPGRRGHGDRFYAELAAQYVALHHAGSTRPIVDLTTRLREQGKPYEKDGVRDLIQDARRRGLLTKPLRGRAGGQLTDKARALLGDA